MGMYIVKMTTPKGCHSSPHSCHSSALSSGLEISAPLYWSLETIWQYFCAVGRRGYNNILRMLSPSTNDAWCQLLMTLCFFKGAMQKEKLVWTQMSEKSNLLWCCGEVMFKGKNQIGMRGKKMRQCVCEEGWALMLNNKCVSVCVPDN